MDTIKDIYEYVLQSVYLPVGTRDRIIYIISYMLIAVAMIPMVPGILLSITGSFIVCVLMQLHEYIKMKLDNRYY